MRSLAMAALLLGLAMPAVARAEFNVNARIPVDITLATDFGDGVDHLAGIAARYRLDVYIYGCAVTAAYDRVELGGDGPTVAHGGSLGGEVFFSPMGFILLLIEDKIMNDDEHRLRRLLDWVNLSIPAGLRVGMVYDGSELKARVAGWVGGELVARFARADWPLWPHLTFSYRRQLGLPEEGAAHHLLFGIGLTRLVAL